MPAAQQPRSGAGWGDDADGAPMKEPSDDGLLRVESSRVNGKAEMSYKRTPIPTAAEAASWVAALGAIPPEGPAEVSHALDLTVRFCTLAYGRNHAVPARSQALRPKGPGRSPPEVVEFQFHGSDDFEKGAHCVAYLYRTGSVSQGVGVVLAFKGSTLNTSDWATNFKWLRSSDKAGGVARGDQLFPDMVDDSRADPTMQKCKVHPGFLQYNRTLYRRMQCTSMASLRGILEEWRAPTTAPHFLSWLHTPGAWQWCAIVGHSLGGAMAHVAAAEIAARTGGTVLLSTLGSPAAGNKAFVRHLNAHVLPGGGLRAFNHGDVVPTVGYSGVAVRPEARSYHSGRRLALWGRKQDQFDSYHVHLRFTVPSTVTQPSGPPKWVTFKLPGMTYKPSATVDNEEFNFGSIWVQDRVVRHESSRMIHDHWLHDLWWVRPDDPHADQTQGVPTWGGGQAPIKASRDTSRRRGRNWQSPPPLRRSNTGDVDRQQENMNAW